MTTVTKGRIIVVESLGKTFTFDSRSKDYEVSFNDGYDTCSLAELREFATALIAAADELEAQ